MCVRGFHTHPELCRAIRVCHKWGRWICSDCQGICEARRKGCYSLSPSAVMCFLHTRSEHCPNYPYLQLRVIKGLKQLMTHRQWSLWSMTSDSIKIESREWRHVSDACPSCMVSDGHHDWRSCLKRMICRRGTKMVNGKRSPLGTHRTSRKDIRSILEKIDVG